MKIGASTGWLYAEEMYSLLEQQNFLLSSGVNAVEFCLAEWDRSDKRITSLKIGKKFNPQKFLFQSVHFPDIIRNQELQFAMIEEIIASRGIVSVVTHPLKQRGSYPVRSYRRILDKDINLAIENMDKMKDSGFDISELKRLIEDTGCGFVMDLQHAYEHGVGYAIDLFETLKNRLVYLHVSGEIEGNNHSLVHKSTNTKEIIELLGRIFSFKRFPIIIEGKYKNPDELRREVEFLREEIGFNNK